MAHHVNYYRNGTAKIARCECIVKFSLWSCRVILAQLEGSGRGALAAYNQEQYTTLFGHLQDVPLSDPDRWLEQLMHKDKALGKRVDGEMSKRR